MSERDLATVMLGGLDDVNREGAFAFAGISERIAKVSERTFEPASLRSRNAVCLAKLVDVTIEDERRVTRLLDASLEVFPGDILGVAGVEGSGHRELLRVLAGRLLPATGEVRLPESIAFIPEDRHRNALIDDFTLTENVALLNLAERRGYLSWKELRSKTHDLVVRFDVKPANPSARARELSGGNQQKLVVGRELSNDPSLIIAESPTRGLDVRASVAISAHLRDAAARGAGVVWYSSDLDELLTMATRVVVLFAGHVAEVALDRTAIARQMVGAE
jgi:general nucleoside transport system ATP-binding protein